jgi:hypothetical protein
MNGEVIVHKSWGDLFVRTTMADRNVPEKKILLGMLEFAIAQEEQSFSGELQAEETVIYWRVGPSPQQGMLHVALARRCERASKFDNMVSFSTHYPGNASEQNDVGAALKKLGPLVQCL